MTYSNFIYDEKSDNLYILVYKLGKGSYSKVWFSLEIENFFFKMKNKKILKINPRALKIHNEDAYDVGIVETELNDLLIDSNKKKSQWINYPLGSFVYEENYVIIVYEVAIGSLYDVMKEFDKKLPVNFVFNIIPQLIKPIEFIHKSKYIHTDIKPENYLLMGLNKLQIDIMTWSNNYGLANKLGKISNLKKFKNIDVEQQIIQEPLNLFLKLISKKFNLADNIIFDDNTDDSIDNINNNCDNNHNDNMSLCSNNSIHSFYSNISDEENIQDYETISSYDSRDGEYFEHIDEFHKESIVKIFLNKESLKNFSMSNNKKNNSSINTQKSNIQHLLEIFANPIVKLTDFGTMKHFTDSQYTIQTRYYRAPEIILGLNFNEKIDLWSLGCTIYELTTGKILFYTCKNDLIKKYDVDLINIKMIFEKINIDEKKQLFDLIENSNRKKYMITNDKCLKFFTNIKNDMWINDIETFLMLNDSSNNVDKIDMNFNVDNLINITKNLLHICPEKRIFI
jgi:serine/threonine-protein kinase SRPK3